MSDQPVATGPGARAALAVALCACAYMLSNVDRQIIGLFVKQIEADLHLGDTQFGLLQGLAFALLYATMGIPIAAASDRRSRPLVIGIGVTVWSLATMCCGAARSFGQILLARATVGVGEAALSPASYSLIADLYPREQLGRATAAYSLGSFLGTTCAFLIGAGLLTALGEASRYTILGHAFHSWQVIFLLVGLPGVPLALAIALWIPEPRRSVGVRDGGGAVSFGETLSWLWDQRAIFLPHLIGYPLYATALYVLLGWSPAFLIRSLAFGTAQAGAWLGTASLLASGAGVLIAGAVLDRAIRHGRYAAPFEIGIVGASGLALSMAVLASASPGPLSLAALACGLFFAAVPMAPSVTIIQMVVPAPMRSRVSALLLLGNNLIGLTCGNIAVGWLNDHAFGGAPGIRLSMPLVVGVAALLSVAFLARGRNPLARAMSTTRHPDLQRIE
jgi:MFS family permease